MNAPYYIGIATNGIATKQFINIKNNNNGVNNNTDNKIINDKQQILVIESRLVAADRHIRRDG